MDIANGLVMVKKHVINEQKHFFLISYRRPELGGWVKIVFNNPDFAHSLNLRVSGRIKGWSSILMLF